MVSLCNVTAYQVLLEIPYLLCASKVYPKEGYWRSWFFLRNFYGIKCKTKQTDPGSNRSILKLLSTPTSTASPELIDSISVLCVYKFISCKCAYENTNLAYFDLEKTQDFADCGRVRSRQVHNPLYVLYRFIFFISGNLRNNFEIT